MLSSNAQNGTNKIFNLTKIVPLKVLKSDGVKRGIFKNLNIEKYKECGVNIDLGNKIVKDIQSFIKNTENSSVLSTSGSFNGMIEYNNTVLGTILYSV